MIRNTSLAIILAAGLVATSAARAQSELSALSALSMLPVASVVGTASAAAQVSVLLPVALSVTGAMLVVESVEVSARGTTYLLRRASDGATASIEVTGRAGRAASLAAGSLVVCTVIASGVVLSAAGEVIAFIPNRIGQALLHNERLTP